MDKYSDNIFDKTLFFEQIVTIPVKAKQLIAITLVWLMAVLLSLALLIVSFFMVKLLLAVVILLIAGIVWLAYRVCQNFFVEYEYIITANDLDIDKIVARNRRNRLITADLRQVSALKKYNPDQKTPDNINRVLYCCEKNDENALCLLVHHQNKGNVMIVFAPNQKMIDAIKQKLPAGVSSI